MISVVLVVGDGDLVDGVGNFIVVVVDISLADVVFPSVVVVMVVDDVGVVIIVAKPVSGVGLVVAIIVVVLEIRNGELPLVRKDVVVVVDLDGVVFVVKGGEEDDTVAVVVVIISDASVGTDVVVVCNSVGCVFVDVDVVVYGSVGCVFVDVVVIVYGIVGCVFVDVGGGGGVNISPVVAAPLVVCCEIANSVDVVEDFVVTKEGY